MTISVNSNITHRYLVISFGWCKLINAPLFWPMAPSLTLQRDWIQCLCLCTLTPLFSTQQKISFLSRPGPPKVISFKNWAVFKHQWPLKIKGQHVYSPQPRSQISPLLEMKGIFKKTSCAWSCLHFCPMGLFGQGCQRLSEHREHKTKTCRPAALWGCQGFAPALVHTQALDVMWGILRDAKASRWFVSPTWLKHVPRAVPDGIAEGQHPGRPCGHLQQDQPQQGAGTRRKGCRLCVAILTVLMGMPQGSGLMWEMLAMLQGTGWEQGSAPPSCPCATQTPAPDVGSGKTEQTERNTDVFVVPVMLIYLFVQGKGMNGYSEVAGKGVGPATAHTHLCTNQYLWMDSPQGSWWWSNSNVSVWGKSEVFVD